MIRIQRVESQYVTGFNHTNFKSVMNTPVLEVSSEMLLSQLIEDYFVHIVLIVTQSFANCNAMMLLV